MPPSGVDRFLVLLEIVLAVVTFVALLRIDAPYGRHSRSGWGPTVPARVGWLVMESPAPLLFAVVFATGVHRGGAVPLVLAALWEIHYVYRAFGYPFLLRPGAGLPVTVVLMAVCFNVLNGWINARWVGEFGVYRTSWFADPRFLAGVLLFAGGLALNATSDRALRKLRGQGGGYRVPAGGPFEYVSCPNYLGEIVEWTGWALATWSLAGFAFALYTFANLAPRALSHHGWYRKRFPDYPPGRRALIPFVW